MTLARFTREFMRQAAHVADMVAVWIMDSGRDGRRCEEMAGAWEHWRPMDQTGTDTRAPSPSRQGGRGSDGQRGTESVMRYSQQNLHQCPFGFGVETEDENDGA